MDPTLPYLFLDIDGVIQANGLRETWPDVVPRRVRGVVSPADAHPHFAWWGGWAPPGRMEIDFRIAVSPELFDAIAALPAQIVIVSDWVARGAAGLFLEQADPRGTPPFPGAIVPEIDPLQPYGPGIWKADLIRSIVQAEPRPFVWADDTEVSFHGPRIAEEFAELPQLQIAPAGYYGLTHQHLADIRAFLEAQRG